MLEQLKDPSIAGPVLLKNLNEEPA